MIAGPGSPSFGPSRVLRLTSTRGRSPGVSSQSGTAPPPENGTGRIATASAEVALRRLGGVTAIVSSGAGICRRARAVLVVTARKRSVAGHSVFSWSTDGTDRCPATMAPTSPRDS
jgi:hypothetical protein